MTDDKHNDSDPESKPEPELLRLWREVAEIRDGLVNQIESWKNHARFTQDFARIRELKGEAPASDWRENARACGYSEHHIAELASGATENVLTLRKRLEALDAEISENTREKWDSNKRGASLAWLRAIIGPGKPEVDAARDALAAWWATRDAARPEGLHEARKAQDALNAALRGQLSIAEAGTPAAAKFGVGAVLGDRGVTTEELRGLIAKVSERQKDGGKSKSRLKDADVPSWILRNIYGLS